jgi:hypothetical protein
MKAAAKTVPAKTAPKTPNGKITLDQALKMYDNSPADKAADLAAAKKLMAAHNKKVK